MKDTRAESRRLRYEGFTVKMALVDALPVLFFIGSILLLTGVFSQALFFTGASLIVIGGLSKVIWKLLMGWKGRDVRLLNKLFVPLMVSGFLLMITGLIVNRTAISIKGMLAAVTALPQVVFFVAGAAAMVTMIISSFTFKKDSAAHNWKAQIINTIAQASFFIGLLLIFI